MQIYDVCRKSCRVFLKIKMVFYQYWNRFLFYCCDVRFGHHFKVRTRCNLYLERNAQLIIGHHFKLSSGNFLNPLCRNIEAGIYVHSNAILTIGDHVGMSSPCLWVRKAVTIGNRVNIGGDTIIMDSDAHSLDYRLRATVDDQKYTKCAPIVIEDDVFVGTRCIILKGVTIGARSVIAAGSVVTKSIPADCIAGGNPCKIIRSLVD